MAVPAGLPERAGAAETAAVSVPASAPSRDSALPPQECFASTVCNLKNRVRWRTPAWTPDVCRRIADGVLTSARRHDVPPALVLAVMLNESDLNENAYRASLRNGEVYAKDSGLMGIRCVLDEQQRCTNGSVRGMAWKEVMDPLTNIDLGARELAKWRRGGGVARVTVRVRDRAGRVQTKDKYVPCQHKTHAYWAHYNHGPVYIDRGPARHYPHRIAVLYYALARALNVDAPELRERVTIRDPGLRERTPERPVEPRYRKLAEQIRGVGGLCSSVASLSARTPAVN